MPCYFLSLSSYFLLFSFTFTFHRIFFLVHEYDIFKVKPASNSYNTYEILQPYGAVNVRRVKLKYCIRHFLNSVYSEAVAFFF